MKKPNALKSFIKKKNTTKFYTLNILFFIFFINIFTHKCFAEHILVLNATSGLGQAIVKKLKSDKHSLILTGRDVNKLRPFIDNNTESVLLDYSNTIHREFAQFMKTKKPKIDGIVIITPRPQLGSQILPKSEVWTKKIHDCFISPLEALRTVLPHLKHNAKVVIIGGLTGVNTLDNHPHSGVIRLMWLAKAKELSRQLADRNIHVNTVSLGGTLTDSFRKGIAHRAKQNNRSFDKQMAIEVEDIPLKTYGTPAQFAEIVGFLLSNKSNHITGANLVVDGGFHRNY